MTLPLPDPAFRWTEESWGWALRCDELGTIAQHAFTTKQLPLRGGPEQQPVAWTQAVAAIGGGLDRLVRVKQVHGRHVRVLRNGEVDARAIAGTPEGDAIVSNAPGLVLSVQVADCAPILMADPVTGAAAAVHAGWRGTAAAVARAAVAALVHEFGVVASNVVAAIGPSIGACCYTVGENVRDAFRGSGTAADQIDQWFLDEGSGRLRLDLWAANRLQLRQAGIPDDRIHVCRLCTQTHRDVFESYRVNGERAGRMAAMIAVP